MVIYELYKTKIEFCNTILTKSKELCDVKKSIHNVKPKAMENYQMKGNWNELKGKLKQKFAVLTDNDLMFEEGKEDEALGKIQQKLGKTKEEWDKLVSEL